MNMHDIVCSIVTTTREYKLQHGIPIHKVILLREIFGARPGNNKLYKTASKLYDRLKELQII